MTTKKNTTRMKKRKNKQQGRNGRGSNGSPQQLPIKINRKPPARVMVPFTDVFQGFERIEPVRKVFGNQTEEVIDRLKVGLVPFRYMYMGVSDEDGNLVVGTHHLKNSDFRTLYLDVVHELFHVKQFMDDKDWFGKEHRKYIGKAGFDTSLYYRSAIEVPAYKHTVVEAKRIGMKTEEIAEYLKIAPTDPKVFAAFLEAVELGEAGATEATINPEGTVQINRDISTPTYRFTDYFTGFEKLPAVKTLLGEEAADVLDRLDVAFWSSPFGMISLNDQNSNLEIATQYLETGDERLIYTDVILCLNLLKNPPGGGGEQQQQRQDPEVDTASSSSSDNDDNLGGTNQQQYVEDPAFFQAYHAAVHEARRVGLSGKEILNHLGFLRFLMPSGSFNRFVKRLGLGKAGRSAPGRGRKRSTSSARRRTTARQR